MSKFLIGAVDFINIFDPCDEQVEVLNIKEQEESEDITTEEYIQNMYSSVFANNKKASDVISQRDLDIIRTYSNEKSFERAVSSCMKILGSFADSASQVSSVCTMDTKIIIDCHNTLIDNKIPHSYKAGMLILSVLYRE